jgi:hypothetical protein
VKPFLTFLACLFCIQLTSRAVGTPNLVTNGDFENGSTGWTFTGDAAVSSQVPAESGDSAVVFSGSTGLDGIVSQTFSTIAGQAYRLTFHYGETNGIPGGGFLDFDPGIELLATIVDSNGNYLVYSDFFPDIFAYTPYIACTALFTPAGSSTTLTFYDLSHYGAHAAGLVDNVSVSAVPATSHAGAYRGTLKLTRTLLPSDISTVTNIPVTLDVALSGAFTGCFDNSETTFDGTLADSGAVTYGDTEIGTGTVTFGKDTIKMTITETSSFDSNFRAYGVRTTHEFSVTRISK